MHLFDWLLRSTFDIYESIMHGYAIKHFDQERLLQLPAVVESLHLPTIEPLMFVLGQ